MQGTVRNPWKTNTKLPQNKWQIRESQNSQLVLAASKRTDSGVVKKTIGALGICYNRSKKDTEEFSQKVNTTLQLWYAYLDGAEASHSESVHFLIPFKLVSADL